MKKRILSIVLAICLVLTLVPTTVFADTSGTTADGFSYTISDAGEVTITGYSGTATAVEIPAAIEGKTVTTIGQSAFWNQTKITSVTIPGSVKTIGASAFGSCRGLTSIAIPGSVTSIGSNPFYNCSKLTSIKVDDSNTSYSSVDGVLFNKEQTVLAVYPCGKTGTSYTIPGSVTSIKDNAFRDCSNLTSVEIPGSVTSIEAAAFSNCQRLTSIEIPGSVTSIGAAAFSYCGFTSVTLRHGVTSIGDNAFSNCRSLTSIEIPGSVTSIGTAAFYNCYVLESTFLPNDLYVANAAIPNTTSQVRYNLDETAGEVTITEIALGIDKTGVAIPATICGYPVVAVADSEQSKVGSHTCKGGTATCTAKAECSLCGKEYGELPAHTYEWKSENGQYWQKCQVCQYETAKKAIPEITIDAPDKVCRTQDCEASVSLPGSLSFAKLSYEFLGLGGDLDMTFEDGKLNGVVKADSYPNVENSFNLVVYAATDDGFPFNVSKTVEIQNEHAGGTATCTAKAVCDTCGEKYGELDSANHDLEKIPAKDATESKTGNKEYWHCLDCGKYFADEKGTNEIKLDDTVIAKLPPEIIEGKGQSIVAGEKKELTFTSNAAFGDFIRVELDGKTLDAKNYTVKEGSTVVTLKADYVATLSAGEHTIGIVSESGTATTTFTVNAKTVVDNDTKSPQTGDNSHMALWIALLAASVFGLAGTAVYSKRKRVR